MTRDKYEMAKIKYLKIHPSLINALLSGQKSVTRRLTDTLYQRSSVDTDIWYYWKLFLQAEDVDLPNGDAYRIPYGSELFVSCPYNNVIKHAPIQPGDEVELTCSSQDGKTRPVARVHITTVSLEHIRDITEPEALDEGFTGKGSAIIAFRDFINTVYPGAWERNATVWVYGFNVVEVL